ncbi:MAG: transcriptional regulator [Deltaproteobacteria bacterium]|nr:transcriptional regulator [Deltaproteobacteria bacterium]
MGRFDHVVRVVRLVQLLSEKRAGVPVRGIADALGVNERTVYRYLQALEREGYRVEGEDGRYRLPRDAAGEVRLTAEEERQLRLLEVAGYPLVGTQILPRVEALLTRLAGGTSAAGGAGRRQGDLLARATLPVSRPGHLAIDYAAHDAVLQGLLKGMDERRTVQARYFSAGRGEETVRELDPYVFHYDASLEALYLIAYCHLRRALRIFAVHRFREVTQGTRGFQRPPGFDVRKFLAGAFRVYRGEQAAEVRLRFSAAVAPRIAERTWHGSQKLRRLAGGAVELELTLDGLEEITAFVLSHGPDVEVLAPATLAARVKELHLRAALGGRKPARAAGEARARPSDHGRARPAKKAATRAR